MKSGAGESCVQGHMQTHPRRTRQSFTQSPIPICCVFKARLEWHLLGRALSEGKVLALSTSTTQAPRNDVHPTCFSEALRLMVHVCAEPPSLLMSGLRNGAN